MFDPTIQSLSAQADPLLTEAEATRKQVRDAAEDLLTLGKEVASSPTEVIGGALGASIGLVLSIGLAVYFPPLAAIIAFAGPAGLFGGVLAARGSDGRRDDRLARRHRIRLDARQKELAALTEQIEKAKGLGASKDTVSHLWAAYQRLISTDIQDLLRTPTEEAAQKALQAGQSPDKAPIPVE